MEQEQEKNQEQEQIQQDGQEKNLEQEKLTLTTIPIPVLDEILKYSNTFDVCRLRGVSKPFKKYIDQMDKSKSRLYFSRFTIKNNIIETNRSFIPLYARKPGFDAYQEIKMPMFNNLQLDWFRPSNIIYEDSTIFESSKDLKLFLKKVKVIEILNLKLETEPNLREEQLNNVCTKLSSIEALHYFSYDGDNLTEQELEKVILSLKCRGRAFKVSLNHHLPCLKQSVLGAILENSKNAMTCIRIRDSLTFAPRDIRSTQTDPIKDISENDISVIVWFFENYQNSIKDKTVYMEQCERVVGTKIAEGVSSQFGQTINIDSGFNTFRLGKCYLHISYVD
ncbi:unnamed protein product [Caenorhabditis angaria]|uniref:F-box domain-containing protein n=1 Tax=Caenorhabditis angaria TaxID=860376 RepID=A0A9P1J1R2_9PELO|nr:unnamed protein product [Caenorhabditis angaria]